MGSTLWVGSRDNYKCVIMISASFVDEVYDLIAEFVRDDLEMKDLMQELNDGYLRSVWLDLTKLNQAQFASVQNAIEKSFSERLKEFVEKPSDFSPRRSSYIQYLFFFGILKAGCTTDDRSASKVETISITYRDKEIVVQRWCMVILLEGLILNYKNPLSEGHTSLLYQALVNLDDRFDLAAISDVLITHAASVTIDSDAGEYIKAHFLQFKNGLMEFLRTPSL